MSAPKDHLDWNLSILGTELVDLPAGAAPQADSILRLNVHPQTRNKPVANEIAGLLPIDGDTAERGATRDVIVFPRGRACERINELDPSYEPMHYVLPFPYGNVGYHPFLRRQTVGQKCQGWREEAKLDARTAWLQLMSGRKADPAPGLHRWSMRHIGARCGVQCSARRVQPCRSDSG